MRNTACWRQLTNAFLKQNSVRELVHFQFRNNSIMLKSCKINMKMLSLYLAYFEMFSNVDFLVLSNLQILNHWFWQMFLIGLIKIKTIWDVRSASSDSRNCQILQMSPGIKQNCSFLNLHNRLCHESSCFWKKLGGIKCKNLVCTTSTWRLGGGSNAEI